MITHHVSQGISIWIIPIYVDLDVDGSSNDYAIEFYDSDGDGDGEYIWQEQWTGMDTPTTPGLCPNPSINGKFWVRSYNSPHTVIIEKIDTNSGQYIFMEVGPYTWHDHKTPEYNIDGDWWRIP